MTSLPSNIAVQLDGWQDFAQKLANLARLTTTRHFRTPVPAQIKADNSPVTLADKETETALRECILQHFPEHGIQGEEWGIENADAELRWVIDPIDGTKAFLAGMPTFVTLIALCYRATPILGIIDQPILQERWVGAYEQATRYNGEIITRIQDAPSTLHEALIATTDPALFAPQAATLYRKLRAACSNQICGGDGYMYGRLCSGIPHLVCEYGLKPHDFAALVPVIEGAGGRISDWQGNPLSLNSQEGDVLAACSPDIHQAAINKLNA